MHRYYLFFKDDGLTGLNAQSYMWMRKFNRELIERLSLASRTITRKVVKELMRVCSEDEDLTDVAEKFERLYVAKTLLGEE